MVGRRRVSLTRRIVTLFSCFFLKYHHTYLIILLLRGWACQKQKIHYSTLFHAIIFCYLRYQLMPFFFSLVVWYDTIPDRTPINYATQLAKQPIVIAVREVRCPAGPPRTEVLLGASRLYRKIDQHHQLTPT